MTIRHSTLLSIVLLAATALPAPARADYTTRINPAVSGPVWEGWGTSLAWWAKAFGHRDDMADLLSQGRRPRPFRIGLSFEAFPGDEQAVDLARRGAFYREAEDGGRVTHHA